MMAEPELLKDFHEYGANINTREIFLHNHYHAEDNQNPGVEYRMSNTFVKNLRALDMRANANITIHCHSIGGEWADGMAIYDAIKLCRSYVTIIIYGQAESMSSIFMQAADYRYMTPNAHFMSHYGSTDVNTDYQELRNLAQVVDEYPVIFPAFQYLLNKLQQQSIHPQDLLGA
jgi:ATP-dependent protease ClpP protease subunit